MKSLYKQLLLVTSLVLAISSCKNQDAQSEQVQSDEGIIELNTEQFTHASMKLGTVALQKFYTEIQLNGNLEAAPHNRASLSTYYGGFISYSPYLIGDQVSKGQVLIKMKNPDFIELQENYLKAYENHKYLAVDYQRQSQLYEKSVIADKDFQEIDKTYKSALADVNSMGAQLELLDVDLQQLQEGSIQSELLMRSPIDGVIADVELNLGSYIPAQTEMMQIVNQKDLHLELDAFEKDLLGLEKGQEISFKVVGSPKTYKATLALIGSEVDAQSRTVAVHAELNEYYSELVAGLFVNAVVYSKPESLYALPKEAVIHQDGQYYVLVLEEQTTDGYRFVKQEVELHKSNQTHFGFKASDLEGKQLLISGGFQLF